MLSGSHKPWPLPSPGSLRYGPIHPLVLLVCARTYAIHSSSTPGRFRSASSLPFRRHCWAKDFGWSQKVWPLEGSRRSDQLHEGHVAVGPVRKPLGGPMLI